MNYDSKVFWRFVWHDQLHPRNWINNSTFYEYIMMFTILYAVIFSDLTLQRKAILFIGFLIGISIIKFYALYKSGQHRHWNRKKYGIPSRNDIKRMKQKRIQEKEGRNNLPDKELEVLGIPKSKDKMLYK